MKPRVGVSSCLLGAAVRWDGRDKRSDAVLDLGDAVEWISVCPEVELGLGVPRPPILIEAGRLVEPSTGRDLTDAMLRWADARLAALAPLDGYVLKSRSPSCGLDGGLFAAALVRHYPRLPVSEEGPLADPATRKAFLDAVLAAFHRRSRP